MLATRMSQKPLIDNHCFCLNPVVSQRHAAYTTWLDRGQVLFRMREGRCTQILLLAPSMMTSNGCRRGSFPGYRTRPQQRVNLMRWSHLRNLHKV